MLHRISLILCVCLGQSTLTSLVASDQIPGAPQKRPIALVNGVIHTVSGGVIPEGTLVFAEGRITEMGTRLAPPSGADVVDLQGKHVYPGLIESHSQLGLQEISSTRSTIDSSEGGLLNPNVSANVSVNPDSELIPVTRANGVLIAVSAPSGGLVSGRASVMQMDGWTWEAMTLKPAAALVVNWPSGGPSFRSPAAGADNAAENREDPVQSLRGLFRQAKQYLKARQANPSGQQFDSRLASMEPVLNGQIPLMISADDVSQIQAAVAFGVEQKIKVILFGGYDAEQCAELLKRYDVPVIISAIHRDPRRDHEDYDSAFTLPERLRRAGIRFCISGSGRAETWNTRNLPYQAATAAAYGLPRDEALRAITLYPAQILGVADRVGSLDAGRDATLFVSTGDPLETETQITHAWIQGRKVDLTSRHTQLNAKYLEKYRQLAEGR